MPLQPTAPETQALFLALNDALPQTQCTRCGFPDCASYARAMAEGKRPSTNAHRVGKQALSVWLH